MRQNMTLTEFDLRLRLDSAVRRMRSAIDHCPAVDEVAFVDPEVAATRVEEANQALGEATKCVSSLERLTHLSEEAAQIASCSRVAFPVIRELLTVLTAEIDHQTAA